MAIRASGGAKNVRKQTHSKIQFYIGTFVTTVEKTILPKKKSAIFGDIKNYNLK